MIVILLSSLISVSRISHRIASNKPLLLIDFSIGEFYREQFSRNRMTLSNATVRTRFELTSIVVTRVYRKRHVQDVIRSGG